MRDDEFLDTEAQHFVHEPGDEGLACDFKNRLGDFPDDVTQSRAEAAGKDGALFECRDHQTCRGLKGPFAACMPHPLRHCTFNLCARLVLPLSIAPHVP